MNADAVHVIRNELEEDYIVRGVRAIDWQAAEIERLRAEVAMWEHRAECHFFDVGGCICAECDRLEAAAAAARGKT